MTEPTQEMLKSSIEEIRRFLQTVRNNHNHSEKKEIQIMKDLNQIFTFEKFKDLNNLSQGRKIQLLALEFVAEVCSAYIFSTDKHAMKDEDDFTQHNWNTWMNSFHIFILGMINQLIKSEIPISQGKNWPTHMVFEWKSCKD